MFEPTWVGSTRIVLSEVWYCLQVENQRSVKNICPNLLVHICFSIELLLMPKPIQNQLCAWSHIKKYVVSTHILISLTWSWQKKSAVVQMMGETTLSFSVTFPVSRACFLAVNNPQPSSTTSMPYFSAAVYFPFLVP